ncbi:hypothetical protein KSP39_PZI012906 [Platanthera zijinensis]|uniref:Uncharacterized protein n=1 Tax=Platanthera zijinensis TaxID=2320716 RepID=A0AAP0BD48_9ASPA
MEGVNGGMWRRNAEAAEGFLAGVGATETDGNDGEKAERMMAVITPDNFFGAASIITVATGKIEFSLPAKKLDKLKKNLEETPYNPEGDFDSISTQKRGLFRREDLVEIIQASEEEMRAALKSLAAVEVDGYWMIVANESMSKNLTFRC